MSKKTIPERIPTIDEIAAAVIEGVQWASGAVQVRQIAAHGWPTNVRLDNDSPELREAIRDAAIVATAGEDRSMHKIAGVTLTDAALECLEHVHAVPGRLPSESRLALEQTIRADVAAIRAGDHTRASLLDECCRGARGDAQGWLDYTSAIVDAVLAPVPPDDPAIREKLLAEVGTTGVRYDEKSDEWHVHTETEGWHFRGYGSELADEIATRDGIE